MNKKDMYLWEKGWLSKFDRTILTRKNSMNEIGSHGYAHERVVFEICHKLRKHGLREWISIDICKQPNPTMDVLFIDSSGKYLKGGCDFYTEVRSVDRKFRADIVAMTYPTPTIIEVADSESDESLEKKRKYWTGEGFEFVVVRV